MGCSASKKQRVEDAQPGTVGAPVVPGKSEPCDKLSATHAAMSHASDEWGTPIIPKYVQECYGARRPLRPVRRPLRPALVHSPHP